MYSMKRRVCPVPRKWRAMLDDAVVVDAALDDRVDLHREARPSAAASIPSSTRVDGEVDVVHRAERRVVERVEADVDAVEPRVARAPRALRARSDAFVVSVEVEAVDRGEPLDERLELASQERLAAREADLLDAERDEHARDPLELLEREELLAVHEAVAAARTPTSACSRRSGSCSGR